MHPAEKKQIFAVSFGSAAPAEAEAEWENGALSIVSVKKVLQSIDTWIPDLLSRIRTRLEGDWVVIVDDKTGSFSEDVINYDFDATDSTGRTRLQQAFDWYFSLQSQFRLGFSDSASRYALNPDSANGFITLENDEKGRVLYKIDHVRFTQEYRVMLLCVAGACIEEPLSERWMKKFLGVRRPIKKPPMFPAFRVMRGLDEVRFRAIESAIDETEARKHVRD